MVLLGPHQRELLESGREDVSRAEWRSATAADALTARDSRPARVQPRIFASPAHKIAAMAELMASRAAIDGSCSEQDLRCAGFSGDDVTLYGSRAQVMAGALTRDRVAA